MMVSLPRVFFVLASHELVGALVVRSSDAKGEHSFHANTSQQSMFMMTSGLTSSNELCVVVDGGRTQTVGAALVLEACATAIASGDGRELFALQPNGQLRSV